jgi:GrpB-like predicted nucleotidyltransferase (UPF0157 family)
MIEIVAYQSAWPGEFQRIAEALSRSLGNAAERIDHIGSTAVPGLCAKDVVDIQLTVARLAPGIAQQLSALGFERCPDIQGDHVPPGCDGSAAGWAKFFFVQPAGERRINLHVREAGCLNQRYALLFRDYLRAHPSTAAAYGELKRRLAAALADDDCYPDVKDPAVDLIWFAAEAWAARTAWSIDPPGPARST